VQPEFWSGGHERTEHILLPKGNDIAFQKRRYWTGPSLAGTALYALFDLTLFAYIGPGLAFDQISGLPTRIAAVDDQIASRKIAARL
jgi:hypothetical protein